MKLLVNLATRDPIRAQSSDRLLGPEVNTEFLNARPRPLHNSFPRLALQEPMKPGDPLWAGFLLSIAKGHTHDVEGWTGLGKRLRQTITKGVGITQSL
jgi:hypothetical protein